MKTPKRWLVDLFKRHYGSNMWRLIAPSWRLKSGVRVEVSSEADWIIFSDIFLDGEDDEPIRRMRAIHPAGPWNVVDVGANVGFFSLRVVDQLPTQEGDSKRLQICAIEGAPSNYDKLLRRLAFSGSGRLVTPYLGLIGERSGTGLIYESLNHGLNSTRAPAGAATSIKSGYLDLEKILPPSAPIHLLKCDIEGSEQKFIEEYPELWPRVERAVFELHHDLCDTERCGRLLAQGGLTRRTDLRKTPAFSVSLFERAES
jgi:FkbM family methyltransferase